VAVAKNTKNLKLDLGVDESTCLIRKYIHSLSCCEESRFGRGDKLHAPEVRNVGVVEDEPILTLTPSTFLWRYDRRAGQISTRHCR
jgi:hypothetical protein